MAKWIEVSFRVDGEAAEAIAQELQRWCHQGVSIEQVDIEPEKYDDGEVPPSDTLIVRGYFADDPEAEEKRLQIERTIGYLNMMLKMPAPQYRVVDDEEWAEAWKVHYKPIRLGQHILVRPLWIDIQPEPGDIVISLDPGMAFGTGTHPTTQLCMESLERIMQPAITVLDLGCGSGILSILAAHLGAGKVVAVDIDQLAVDSTLENVQENSVADQIQVYRGGLDAVLASAQQFDLIVVNILARIIIQMCDQRLGDTVRPGGQAIFSGIIEEQANDVEIALRKTGLEPLARHQQGDWIVIEAHKPA
jgi:ribosomal protein L11 methyltransferase